MDLPNPFRKETPPQTPPKKFLDEETLNNINNSFEYATARSTKIEMRLDTLELRFNQLWDMLTQEDRYNKKIKLTPMGRMLRRR